MKTVQAEEFFARLKKANPNPVTELEYTTVFELLAAVLLSAQATDVSVNKATRKLFPVANTPQALLDLGLDGLESTIKTIGLYHSKASSTASGVLPGARPVRLPSLKIWVSTAMVGSPNAEFKITLAVFRPTPGRACSASRSRGTAPACCSMSIWQVCSKCRALLW